MYKIILVALDEQATEIKNASKRIIFRIFPYFFGISFLFRASKRFLITVVKGSRVSLCDWFVMGSDCRLVLEKEASLKAKGAVRFDDRCTVIVHSGGELVLEGGNWFMSDCWIEVSEGQTIYIGANSTFQKRCELHGSIRIGDDCVFAPDVFMSSGGHSFERDRNLTIRQQDRKFGIMHAPLSVGDSCWIGIRAWISPGVVVGRKSVVGANSVVTRDTREYSVNAGIPSRELRRF